MSQTAPKRVRVDSEVGMSLVDRLLLQYAVHKGIGSVVRNGNSCDAEITKVVRNIEPSVVLEHAHIISPSSETARTAGISICSLSERLKSSNVPEMHTLIPRLYRACLASIYTEAERQIFRQISNHLLDDEDDEESNSGKTTVSIDGGTWQKLKDLTNSVCGENQIIWMGMRATIRVKQAKPLDTTQTAVPSLDRLPTRIYQIQYNNQKHSRFIKTAVDRFGTFAATSHETDGVRLWRITNKPIPDSDPLPTSSNLSQNHWPKRLIGHNCPVYDLQFVGRENGESTHICTAGGDGKLILWSLYSGDQVTNYHTFGELSNVTLWSLDTQHSSNRLVTGAQNRAVCLFDFERRKPVRLWTESAAVDSVKFGTNENIIYAASNQLTQYDARTSNISLVYSLQQNTPVQQIISTSDDRYVIISHEGSGNTTTYDTRSTLPLPRSPSMPSPLVSLQIMESTGDYVLLGDDHGRVAIDCAAVQGCSAGINRYQLPNITQMQNATFVEAGEIVVLV